MMINEKEIYIATIEAISEAILVCDEDQRIEYVNKSAVEMFGLSREHLLSKRCWELQRLEDSEGQLVCGPNCDMWCTIRDNNKFSCPSSRELYFIDITKGKRVPVYHQVTPLLVNNELKGSVLLYRDISEQKALESAKEMFRHMVIHDLKNPIMVVANVLSYLSKECRDITDLNRYAKIGLDSVNLTLNLANDFLELAKMTEKKMHIFGEQVKLTSLIDSVIDQMSSLFQERNIKVNTQYAFPDVVIFIDQGQIRRVFQNLLDNALKHSLSGAEIKICTEKDNTGFVRINIIDQGPGILANDLPYLFQPFYVGSKELLTRVSGVGLGLAYCSEVIKHHGGKIWVDSTSDIGTTFSLTLPLSQ